MKTLKLIENHILNRTLPSMAENDAVYERFYKKHWTHTDDYAVDWLYNRKGHPSWLAARYDLMKVKTTAWVIIEAVAKRAGHCRKCCEHINWDWSDDRGWKEYSLCRKCYRKHERDRRDSRGFFEKND